MKRLLSTLLVLSMFLGNLPVAAFASEVTVPSEETVPVITEETVSAGETTAPAAEETVSATEETIPATEKTVSATEETVPSTEETVSATEETVPATEETVPTTEETVPTTEETVPTTEETVPTTEETEKGISAEKEMGPALEKTDPEEQEGTVEGGTLDASNLLGESDELLRKYLENILYRNPNVSVLSSYHRDNLPVKAQEFYDQIAERVHAIANGSETLTKFDVSATFTAEELGVPQIWLGYYLSNAAQNALGKQLPVREILMAILQDIPYDCYWFDKTSGWSWSYQYRGDPLVVTMTLTMPVSVDYADFGGSYDSKNDWYIQTDKSKTDMYSRAAHAAETARNVVAQYEGFNDVDKLYAYRDYICGAVEYDYDAAYHPTPYGDPWQLINVFDENTATNVVCEGYAKAFQYLCDLTTFQGNVECYQNRGDVNGGGHMWNVVKLDGILLHADTTWSDSSPSGPWFLTAVKPLSSTSFKIRDTEFKNVTMIPASIDDMQSYVELAIPEPAAGEKPVLYISDSTYEAYITWSPECQVFEKGTNYTADVIVKPVNAPFYEDTVFTYGGMQLKVTSQHFDRHCTVSFPGSEDQLLGWVYNAGHLSYYYEDGSAAVGFADIEGCRYYFDENGYAVKGLADINGSRYYFDENYIMTVGWNTINGSTYYFGQDGVMSANGWYWITGDCYYFYEDGTMARDCLIDGSYVDVNGVWVPEAKSGWKQDSEGWQFFYIDGSPALGWTEIDGTVYYFDTRGYMVTGWKSIDGDTYYFAESGGRYENGWYWIDGSCYYFYTNGYLAKNTWIDENYVNETGAWDPNVYKEGWVETNDRRWYRYSDGSCPKGIWKEIDGSWYFFDGSGWMLEGWQFITGNRFYLDQGRMVTGFMEIDGSLYYFNSYGHMVHSGWFWAAGLCYYANPDGSLARNTWIDGAYVDANGKWIPNYAEQGWVEENGRRWYRHADGSCTRNAWEQIDGSWYFFDNSGWMLEGWQFITDNWFYLDHGRMVTGFKEIGGNLYYFNGSGYMARSGWFWADGLCYYANPDGSLARNTWIDGSYVGNDGAWDPAA